MSTLRELAPALQRARVINTKEAAAFLGMSVPTFRRRKRDGDLPGHIALSHRLHGYRIGDLIDWTERRQERAQATRGGAGA